MRSGQLWSALLILASSHAAHAGFTTRSGDWLKYGMPAAAAGLGLYQQDWQGLQQFGLAFGSTVVTTYGLKTAVPEQRPNGEGDDAFPSGHAAATFSAASFVQRRYGWQLGAPAYLLAAWTGYTRVQSHNHRWIDVLAGAGIGTAFSFLWVKPDANWQLSPWFDGQQAGLTAAARF